MYDLTSLTMVLKAKNKPDTISNINMHCLCCQEESLGKNILLEKYYNETLIEIYSYIINYTVHSAAEMPSNICTNCEKNLLISYTFIKELKEARQFFQNRISFNENLTPQVLQDRNPGENLCLDASYKFYTSNNKLDVSDECNGDIKSEIILVDHEDSSGYKCEEIKVEDIEFTDSKENTEYIIVEIVPHNDGETKENDESINDPINKSNKCRKKVSVKGKSVKELKCRRCGQKFNKMDELSVHRKMHHTEMQDEVITCKICYKDIKRKSMPGHLLDHKRSYQCTICGNMLQSASAFRYHLNHVHEKKPIKRTPCTICGLLLNNCRIKRHTESHGPDRTLHKCPYCDITFNSKGNIRRHVNYKHLGIKKYQCVYCGQAFGQKNTMCTHVLSKHPEVENNDDPNMKEIVKIAKELKQKTRNYLQSKKSSDIQTDDSFTGCYSNKRAERDPKSYAGTPMVSGECSICNRKVRNLKYHLAMTHAPNDSYKCTFCPKTFKNKILLGAHEDIHKNVKKFQCDICSRRFTQNIHLQYHKIAHSKEKNYQCEICNNKFRYRPSLLAHIREYHNDEMSYKCFVCGEKFKFRSHKRNHMKEVHPDEVIKFQEERKVDVLFDDNGEPLNSKEIENELI